MDFLLFRNQERKLVDFSLCELEEKVYEIKKEQNYISNLGLSAEVTLLVIGELQEQKNKLLKVMHKKVDEL